MPWVTKIKFLQPYERAGKYFEMNDKVEPSDIHMSMDEAEALAHRGIIEIQRVRE